MKGIRYKDTTAMPGSEQALMTSQLDIMQDLSDTLWQRINPKKSQ